MADERCGWRKRMIGLLIGPAGLWLFAATPAWAKTERPPDPLGALTLLLLLPLAVGVLIALELVLWVLAPAPLLATSGAIERGRGRCLVTGLGAAVVTVVLLSLLNRYPAVGKTAGPLLVGIAALGCLTGVTAVVALVGRGALDLAGLSGSRALAVIVGSVLFGLVILFPIAGQVLGLYFLLVGLGGAIRALARSIFGGK